MCAGDCLWTKVGGVWTVENRCGDPNCRCIEHDQTQPAMNADDGTTITWTKDGTIDPANYGIVHDDFARKLKERFDRLTDDTLKARYPSNGIVDATTSSVSVPCVSVSEGILPVDTSIRYKKQK